MALTLLDVGAGLLALFIINRLLFRKAAGPLPPGPKPLPVLGNALDMPSSHEWLTFAKWKEQYGDIISVNVFGTTYIILGSMKHAVNLLDKRSAIYSCRPIITVGGEMVGWSRTLAMQHYGPSFREYRRLIFQSIGTRKLMEPYHALVEAKTRDCMVSIAQNPENRVAHLQKAAGAIILMIGYGYTPAKEGVDPFIHTVDTAMEQFSISTSPGGFLANLFPILQYVPSWFPGAGWKHTAAAWRKTLDQMCDEPLDFVKKQMTAGTSIPNFVSKNLEGGVTPERELLVRNIAASFYSGGADTTWSSSNTFFLAMALHPHVAKKAQEELDRVVGNDRLPSLDDRENLPYVTAVFMENFRWHAVAPLAIPHRVIQDDVYEGYVIPKGAIIIPNIWAMLHDAEQYPDPMTFNPERFIAAPGREVQTDPREIAFGFGRRTCPGMQLADLSVWLSIAQTLSLFNISKPVENGKVVEPVVEFLTGTVSHAVPNKFDIKPRSAKAEALLAREARNASA